MTTVFHAWLYVRFIEIQSNLRTKKLHRTNQGSNFLGGNFSNRNNLRAPIQFRMESQSQHLKRQKQTHPFSHQQHQYQTGQTELVQFFPALKSTSILLPQFSCCHRSDALSHLKQRVVSSTQINILQITSPGRSLMCSRKSVGPRMDP